MQASKIESWKALGSFLDYCSPWRWSQNIRPKRRSAYHLISRRFLALLINRPRRQRRNVSPKRRSTDYTKTEFLPPPDHSLPHVQAYEYTSNFLTPYHSSGAHRASHRMGDLGSFSEGKAAGAWSWPLSSNYCRGKENVDLYFHSPYAFTVQCWVKQRGKFHYGTNRKVAGSCPLFKYKKWKIKLNLSP
jgi:hypothetical protein